MKATPKKRKTTRKPEAAAAAPSTLSVPCRFPDCEARLKTNVKAGQAPMDQPGSCPSRAAEFFRVK
jgi:hypothetical protein